MKTDTRSANSCALPAKYPKLDSDDTICNASAQTALPLAEMISGGKNDDSNDDATVLRRDDDASCLAAMPTIAWHSDDLIQKREQTMAGREWTENFDGQNQMTRGNSKPK